MKSLEDIGLILLTEPTQGRHTLTVGCSSSPPLPRHRFECTLPNYVE